MIDYTVHSLYKSAKLALSTMYKSRRKKSKILILNYTIYIIIKLVILLSYYINTTKIKGLFTKKRNNSH